MKIGGGTGTAVLDDFLLCFRLDPILLSMMDLSTKRIMSMQIVIPGSALCLVTTGCVDVIELSTLVLTSFMVLASCIAGPLWLVVVIYVMSIILWRGKVLQETFPKKLHCREQTSSSLA